MAGISDRDIDTISRGVGRRGMRQIAQGHLGFPDGIDDLLMTYDDTALNDSDFNTLVLKEWRRIKGGTNERLRLYTALSAAKQAGVDINPDSFSFLIETPHSPGQLYLLYSAIFWWSMAHIWNLTPSVGQFFFWPFLQ